MSMVPLKGAYADLRALTVVRRQVNTVISSMLNNIHCVIDEYFPELETLFGDIAGMTSLWVLSEVPFPSDVIAMDLETLVIGIKTASNRRQGLKKALALKEAAQRSIGCMEGLAGTRVRLDTHLATLKMELERLEQIETEMEVKLSETGFKDILLSAPGVGLVTAATLLGEMGSPDGYDDWRQVRKLAGLNLVHQSSGAKRGKTTVSKRGRPGLRHVLYMIALAMSSKNAEMKTFFNALKSRSDNPLSKMSAMTALSCKVLRVLFTMMKFRQTYDPTKVLGVYRSNQAVMAA
jgi:transposase